MAKPSIDLTQFCEHELLELNRKIVDRVRYLREARTHHQMLEHYPGEKVSFSPEPGRKVVATIVRLNRKSVSLVTPDGTQWRVSPTLLSRVEPKDVEAEVVAPAPKEDARHSPPIPLRMAPLTTVLSPPIDAPRNAPCPCGSGKKYKRCCLMKAAVGYRR